MSDLDDKTKRRLERLAAKGDEPSKILLGLHAGKTNDVIRWLAANSSEFAMEPDEVERFLAEYGGEDD